MFIDNHFTRRYYKFIERCKDRNTKNSKQYYNHHIIPKSLGGDNSNDNLVKLSYKEHMFVHWLLTLMTEGSNKHKMQHAFRFFDRTYMAPEGFYKRGKDNIFSTPEIRQMVSERMKRNNPMKQPHQRERMKLTNHRNRKICTPEGTFISRAAALRHHGFKHWKILYNLMESYPQEYYWITNEDSFFGV